MGMSPTLMRPRNAFTPKNISGLALWLDASDATTLGPTSTGTGAVLNNGPVHYWADKSGNGRHAANAGADSVCPVLATNDQNGKNTLSCDGGDFLAGSLNVTLTSQTVFAVAKFSTSAGYFGRFFTQYRSGQIDTEANVHYIPLIRDASNSAVCSYQNAVRGSMSVANNSWCVFMSSHTGTSIGNRLNNGTEQTASSLPWSLNLAAANYSVCGVSGDAGFATRVAEILMWTRVLTDAERNSVAKYLGVKWGIVVS